MPQTRPPPNFAGHVLNVTRYYWGLTVRQSAAVCCPNQTRAFDTTDKPKTLRTVIATLQDLGFVMDKVDQDLGSVSATKLDGYALRITVSVRPRGEKQLAVRANAQYNVTTVDDPEPYQQFFAALEKAMFLTAQQVE